MGTLTGKGLIKFRLEYLNVLVINFFPTTQLVSKPTSRLF